MPEDPPIVSARRPQLLEAAYDYALSYGLADLSLRPLAAAIGSSPRVLLYLFGDKDGLVRALLARARSDELALLQRLQPTSRAPLGLVSAAEETWRWLSAPAHRRLLVLWAEAYTRSLVDPDGPWSGFARSTVHDWLDVLADAQTSAERRTKLGVRRRTLALAALRGALLDLLATGERERVDAAIRLQLDLLDRGRRR